LNSDELQILGVFTLGFQAELGGLSNTVHQLIERPRLGVASLEFRDRSNVKPSRSRSTTTLNSLFMIQSQFYAKKARIWFFALRRTRASAGVSGAETGEAARRNLAPRAWKVRLEGL
jgi:hypothetical protein